MHQDTKVTFAALYTRKVHKHWISAEKVHKLRTQKLFGAQLKS